MPLGQNLGNSFLSPSTSIEVHFADRYYKRVYTQLLTKQATITKVLQKCRLNGLLPAAPGGNALSTSLAGMLFYSNWICRGSLSVLAAAGTMTR